MGSRTEVAQQYLDAQVSRDAEKIDALASKIADDAVLVSPRGQVAGQAAIVDRLKNPPYGGGGGGGMMGQIQWSAPVEEGDAVKTSATLPANPMGMTGMSLTFSFTDDDRISRIEMAMQS